ncbi:MAG: nucleotidyltransferase [Paludibacteraceae bacterium]|nr:nucleotidyltransferase [Paludibacteraceae bacterium]MDI9536355.1 nucleotidyltransferase [Bacteroidota bacterium]MBP9040041.1 nucleotidyltransferase [Paludibacteraceae bacterium]HOG37247.1 nucleotidyltransferase [Paludibacteraceae bacterium]HOS38047.1 nucleotidyltransferase [Paludibacteraceae bacterium]
MKPTLLILAAGMGSRYGGLKQLDGIGPCGETIMDYSVFDAKRAGFGKIVFVIRSNFKEDFFKRIVSRYANHIDVDVVYQEIESVPEGCAYNTERTKPWGTNHAVLMGKKVINTPFAVINADDFYGKDSYGELAKFLIASEGRKNSYCMVGYQIGNTLSESGTVSRGVCSVEGEYLSSIVECGKIGRENGVIRYPKADGTFETLESDTPVSMNMWGFTPDYFDYSEEAFRTFLKERGNEPTSEFYIPTMINDLIVAKKITCKVLRTTSKWFGVTYAEDKQQVISKINQLIADGCYPKQLWE